jgi:hypothetical protein
MYVISFFMTDLSSRQLFCNGSDNLVIKSIYFYNVIELPFVSVNRIQIPEQVNYNMIMLCFISLRNMPLVLAMSNFPSE